MRSNECRYSKASTIWKGTLLEALRLDWISFFKFEQLPHLCCIKSRMRLGEAADTTQMREHLTAADELENHVEIRVVLQNWTFFWTLLRTRARLWPSGLHQIKILLDYSLLEVC